MSRFLGAACALVILAACSQGNQAVDSAQNPSQPTGSVVGVVTSLRTGAPLQGVTVSVPAPGGGTVSAATDARGTYALVGLLAGAHYTVRFAAAGFVPRFGEAFVPNSAGDYPSNGIAQLDMPMAQANATLSGHVYARDGAPANGVALVADLRGQGFDLVATATTDATGAYALTGLPGVPTGLPVAVVAQPWDANGDGVADYDALAVSGTTYPGATALLDVDLRRATPDLLLLTSNVESATIAADAPVQLTFNQALDVSMTTVALYDSTAGRTVAVETSFDTTKTILKVMPTPSGTSLAAGHAFSLMVDAVAAVNGSMLSTSRSFTAEVPMTVLPAVTGLTVTPVAADFDTSSFTISWKASANASGYQVWVRDTNRNPDYLLVRTVGSSPAPSTTVALPATFDWYTGDAIQTPFAFGVGVDFAVVAVNAAGALQPSSVTPVHRADTVAPAVQRAVQGGNADNSLGTTARTITLAFTFSEYVDTSVLPTITVPSGVTASPFVWNANATSGTVSLTVAASTDGRGAYTLSGAKDTSGNAMAPYSGSLLAQVQLVSNGGFETGTLGGWTTAVTSTATAPVVTSAVAASGSSSAQLGNATGATGQGGYSRLYQNVALPIGYSQLSLSMAYRAYTTSYGYDSASCSVQDSTGVTTYSTIFSTTANATAFATATLDLTARAGQTVRITCQSYQSGSYVSGLYVDDVSIVATP